MALKVPVTLMLSGERTLTRSSNIRISGDTVPNHLGNSSAISLTALLCGITITGNTKPEVKL
jgi:hypothetical protein